MSSLLPLESGVFDTIAGLPVHPLVVHAVVVLLPVSALAFIVIYLVPRWRRHYGWLTMGALAGGVASALVAKESGEMLAGRVGLPQLHSQLATTLVAASVATFVVAAVWFWLQRRAARAEARSLPATVLGALASLMALGVIVLTVLVGHSGATAVWAGVIGAS
jgi:hypothetical protein